MSYRASASKGGKAPNGRGQSAAAKHAYHLRQGLYAVGRDGPREDLAASGHGNLPEFAADDPAAFWLASDSFERANGTLYRELQVNLPHELGLTQQQQVLQKFCARMFDRERLPHSWAIHNHADGDHVPDDNGHGHIMVSETMTDDFPRPAEQHFKRHNSAKPEAGGAKKTRSLKPKSWLMEARAAWAEEVNRGLVAAGHKPRFDHRSKKVQRDEALRLGDLRQAARLDTPTQAHEGPRIAGMRRRVEAGKVALEDLPSYAQEVIKDNDRVRQYASEWLAQVEQMTDGELAEHFADDLNHGEHVKAWRLHQEQQAQQLAQESPGAHVAAWMGEQHRLALIEDADRELADLIAVEQAQQHEDLTVIELEQAHVAALAEDADRELADLIAVEQAQQHEDLTVIELEQAHVAALAEDQQRTALQIEQLREQVAKLDQYAFHPPRYDEAVELVKQQRAAEHAAAEWRAEHPLAARALDAIGLRSPADREADRAREARQASPDVQEAAVWQRAERERERRLADTRGRLEQLQARMPALQSHAESPPPEPQAEDSSAQRSLPDGLAAMEQWKPEQSEAAREWIEWEDAGELYGQWEDSQQVYWHDSQQGEWLRAEDRPQPEPEPERQRYSGPRMG